MAIRHRFRLTTTRVMAGTLALGLACGGTNKETTEAAGETPQALQMTLAQVGLDPAAIDKTANPCDDFYQYACGSWMANHEIPADKASYGRFYEIDDRNEATLKGILDRAMAPDAQLSPAMARVRDYYGACMNEEAAAKNGKTAIAPMLATIGKVKDKKSLHKAITELHQHRVWPLWSIEAEADFKDATKNILFVDQAGLGLPDRDYYVADDANMKTVREAYVAHMGRMFALAGYKKADADKAAKAVMELETRLAQHSKTATERRDPEGMYNKIDRKGLEERVANFDWKGYFAGLGYGDLDGISITAPKFFELLDSELEDVAPATWRHYLTWHLLDSTAHTLGKDFETEAFSMASVLTGQKEMEPRWKRCLAATNAGVGELLAQPFIDEMFPGNSKSAAEDMVKAITAAFETGVADLAWMSDETKAKAQEKRAAMAYLIGYPEKWKTYDFDITADNYALNALRARAWEMNRQLDKVGKEYDRSEWYMVPQIVNAYYNPLANQMVFPAGILQKPFFDANATVAVNLGSMGMIVGHELTHGFDDSGAQFAADGNMANWWQPADLEQFKGKGECVVKQYAAYEPLPGMHINGELTLGENIADIGGVKFAYQAYKNLRAGKQPIVADGHTEDQQFFLAVGQAWCTKYRDEVLKQRLVTDPHSPARYRVNGSLTNQPAFAEAFSCEKGTAMNPANTCEVW